MKVNGIMTFKMESAHIIIPTGIFIKVNGTTVNNTEKEIIYTKMGKLSIKETGNKGKNKDLVN
jgi:hypothetical protein